MHNKRHKRGSGLNRVFNKKKKKFLSVKFRFSESYK